MQVAVLVLCVVCNIHDGTERFLVFGFSFGFVAQALNAADLRALMYACKKVEMELVFGEECALEQPVLLSLIHQLSHDLSTDTELKTR